MKQEFVNYRVDAKGLEICVAETMEALRNGTSACKSIACLNVYSYVLAQNDADFRGALQDADWLIPDGAGIVWAGGLLGGCIASRITGFEIFEGVMQELNHVGGSVFFLGSTEQTLDLIAQRLATDYPNISLAGTYSPPFKSDFSPEENNDIITAIGASKVDVLWIGMTAPKQEKWIAQNKDRLPVSLAGAIGAVFDFYSGQVKRAPPIFQKLGLEWVHRFASQPSRHWRRTITIPIFVCLMLWKRMDFRH